MNRFSVGAALLATALFFIIPEQALSQVEKAVEAHGGLQKWRSFGAVEYDLVYERPKGEKRDHQLFNLYTRDGLITADNYTMGASNGEVWIKPNAEALGGTPPRFYMWTPFYFFGMPFVFGDPGVQQESLGEKEFQGRKYNAVKITYKAGTGDSPDDYYIAYVDPASGQLKLSAYVVTYASMRKDKPVEQLEPHAIVFEEWQTVDGLKVPKAAAYFNWKNETIEGDALGRLRFNNVKFSTATPDESRFAKPAEAVIAPKP
ncbi:MAG: DUF6503 family protein [Chthoniobacterales bacterium]